MREIWKYPLGTGENRLIVIAMPTGSQVLTAQMQDGIACVWAIVNPRAEKVPVRFRVFGTSIPIHDLAGWRFVNTVQEDEYVWHIFQEVSQ